MLDLWIFTSQKVFFFKIWFYQCQNFIKITNEQVEKLFLRVPRPFPARCSMNLVWKEVLIVSKGFVPCLLISCSTCSAVHCTMCVWISIAQRSLLVVAKWITCKMFLRENEGYLDYLLEESLERYKHLKSEPCPTSASGGIG